MTDTPKPCRSCGAPLLWARTAAGKAIPLDAQPVRRFVLHGATLAETPEVEQVDTYQTHFASCPNADQHRRPR